jgi:cation:H+ antiporter
VLVIAAIVVGDSQIFGIGYWSIAFSGYVVFAFWTASGYHDRARLAFHGWRIGSEESLPRDSKSMAAPHPLTEKSNAKLTVRIVVAAAAILVSGYTLARTGEGIGRQLGMTSGLSGYFLLGTATSLPEFATILAAVELMQIDMAIGEVFGTNLFNIGLVALADVLYRGGPILSTSSRFEIIACLICLLQTGSYALGLMERQRRTFLRMGVDSILVVCIYLGGLVILWHAS